MTSDTKTEDMSAELFDTVAHAIVSAEMAVLRPGDGGISGFLESSLSRKIMYRHVIRSFYRDLDTGISDLIELTGQSRQNVAHQVKEMMDMGLMISAACPDRRKRCLKPTPALMDYWKSYCLGLMQMPKAGEVAAAAELYLEFKASRV